MGGTSNVDNKTIINSSYDPITRRLQTAGSGGSGSVTVTDGVTTVSNVTTIDFTSGATVTSGGVGQANVAITGGSGSPGGLNAQLQYNNAGSFGGITGATTNGTSVSLDSAHLLNPTINGAGAGLATLVYPNTASNATITVPATTGTLALTSQLTSGTVTSVASADGSITVTNPSTTVDLAVVKAPIWTTARLLAGNSVNGSANVPFANKFIVQGTADTGLTGAQFLGALGTGIVKNTTTTGVLSIAINSDLPVMTATVGGAVPTPPNNTTTFLRGDGTFATPAGGGTVTNTGGSLTANSVMLGAGVNDSKVVAGITTDGTSVINLGVNTTTIGKIKFFGNTSGDATIQPTAVAGTATVQTLPATTGTLVNRVTTANGVSASNTDGALTVSLGAITPTTVNGNTFTTGTYTLTGTAGKTLNFTNSITLSGTDATTMTFPTTSKTIAANDGSNWTFASQAIGDIVTASSTTAYTRIAAVALGAVLTSAGTTTQPTWSTAPQITTIELGNASDTTLSRSAAGVLAVEGVVIPSISSTNTLTNKRITPRVVATTQSATPAINSDNGDIFEIVGLAQAVTSMTTSLTGTPVEGQFMEIIFKDNGTARAITWGASFVASTVALPTTTVISTQLAALFQWRTSAVWTTTSAWTCVAVA